MSKSNANRFIYAYNQIDYSLRAIYGFKRSMSFSDVVRRSVVLNSVVRKYEDDLIDYGRLRNAIIHNGNKKYIIAEPHDEIVKEIERLASLITEPPLAMERVGNKEVITIDAEMKVGPAMELMARTGYSNLPIYKGEKLIGILNGGRLLTALGNQHSEGVNIHDFVNNTAAEDIISVLGETNYFKLADRKLTIDEAMNCFENDRKLLVILITRDGKENSKPLSIISYADIVDMKKILDVY